MPEMCLELDTIPLGQASNHHNIQGRRLHCHCGVEFRVLIIVIVCAVGARRPYIWNLDLMAVPLQKKIVILKEETFIVKL